MGTAYFFTLQPTFTQGLILGQFSVLFLLIVVLKYLFLDGVSDRSYKTPSYQPKPEPDEEDAVPLLAEKLGVRPGKDDQSGGGIESADWLNGILQQVLDAYRVKLRDGLSGAEGDEIARRRVEIYANKMRPPGFLDPIRVHSVDLGASAPHLSRARFKTQSTSDADPAIEFDMTYVDALSISISTSVLFHYPFASFARLPISLTISLSRLSSSILLTPPHPHAQHPTMTFNFPSPNTEFTLNLQTKSLMGSRAKLADVPKVHELITHQIRKVILEKGTLKVVLPGLATVSEVQEDVENERATRS
ncbi:uncharacterized protein FIBRA_02976 [Fibroporia radiculosa]|uniref:SMP-LTD domain-containing protein n=1 Tax=Fibroporia radiculosa TaxID=599839 RepID=J4H254_9APHY|nr:uncharacterized protein FIBRA_02976 [Fibroporia radiculosa]CCM00929.1 predicted protein [Fibroporia radiculosa]